MDCKHCLCYFCKNVNCPVLNFDLSCKAKSHYTHLSECIFKTNNCKEYQKAKKDKGKKNLS